MKLVTKSMVNYTRIYNFNRNIRINLIYAEVTKLIKVDDLVE